jgi:hypothetical protein
VEVESIEQAIQANWVSGFYEYDAEHGPACPSCSERLLRMAEDGEFELLEEYRGKIVYLEEAEEEPPDCPDCPMEDVFLGFILN